MDLPKVGLKQVSVPMMAYLGFLLGVSSGLMGIGGGILFMPTLLYGFGLSVRNAAGTGWLIARARNGDRAAFARLVSAHYDFIFRTACKWCGKAARK